jgi:hypothetical protein
MASTGCRCPQPGIGQSGKVAWIENFAAPEITGQAEPTLVMRPGSWPRVEAFDWVEIAVDFRCDGARQLHVLGMVDMARAVGRGQSSELWVDRPQAEAVEHRVLHDRRDLSRRR